MKSENAQECRSLHRKTDIQFYNHLNLTKHYKIMRKNLLLMFALLIMGGVNVYATKTYATYGTPADQGKWDAETGVYTWTQGYIDDNL